MIRLRPVLAFNMKDRRHILGITQAQLAERVNTSTHYIESVHNVDTLWTDFLKNCIFAALGRENARSVRKVTDFVDRHYIGMIESEKKFPTPEMLERIAAALEIEAPALFSTKSYPSPEAGTLARFQEQVLSEISDVISYRIRELERKTPQAPDPAAGNNPTMV
jgi:transcriptional regulator with XRE-family HTH domain